MEQTTLQQMEARFSELEDLIQKPEIMKNGQLYTKYLKEHGALSKIVNKYRELQTIKKEREEAKQILSEEKDSDMRAMVTEEIEELEEREIKVGKEIENYLITDEEQDNRNVIVEIRAGTGGDEACLFAQELFALYVKYAERQYLRLEVLDNTSTELGGIKEVSFSLKGKEAYKKMKYEGGGHRVQRIPSTESGGRIHTSACTIAVLPEVDDVEVEINDTDLRIDYMRASGPGGQNVNKTSSAVRITHIPSGIVVSCQETPEQHKNRMKAMKVLRARLYSHMVEEQQKERNALRKDQSGSGDRNERIRTYNFPQNRVTDHRINHSIYNLESILQGNIDEFVEMLQVQEREDKLKKLGSIIQ
ncbi:peptide chain release factor 1 [Candidatus Uabimicrobium sp. HlEnr_7]|uniref:peptide chain release factor 1 n=1 Tax=Candidatus Uabimicrobium helgolandensis TaxID=3095367 RepID=UPI003557BC39